MIGETTSQSHGRHSRSHSGSEAGAELQCLQVGVEFETETQTLLTASVCCSEHYRLLSHTPLHPRLTIVRVSLLLRVTITSYITTDNNVTPVTTVVWLPQQRVN